VRDPGRRDWEAGPDSVILHKALAMTSLVQDFAHNALNDRKPGVIARSPDVLVGTTKQSLHRVIVCLAKNARNDMEREAIARILSNAVEAASNF
jgi:hypothetical protein